MKRLGLAAMAAFVMAASGAALSAQTRGQAFTEGPVTKEEYAKAIETNNQRVLNVDCKKMVEVAVRQNHVPEGTDCKGLAAYVRSLSVVSCPTGVTASLAWVSPQGDVMLTGLNRPFRNNEQCLLNTQTGIWFASLLCGNFITDEGLPMPGSVETVRPEPPTDLTTQMAAEAKRAAEEAERLRRELAKAQSARQQGSDRGGNAVTRFLSKYKWPLIGTAALGGAAAFFLTRPSAEAEASPSIGINIKIGG